MFVQSVVIFMREMNHPQRIVPYVDALLKITRRKSKQIHHEQK